MRIIIAKDYSDLSQKAAQLIASQITLKPNSVLGFATGGTPLGTYRCLINKYKNRDISFINITSFNLDEYFGLGVKNQQSYSYYMNENLFKHIDINMSKTHIPNGLAGNIELECQEYERKIAMAGGIDLQLLGIGRNGHIGFNEPDINFEATTHLVELDDRTIKDNARYFEDADQVPTRAVSMGIKTIMSADKILLIASGKEKAETVYKMVYEKITPRLPASILQLHRDVTLIADVEAASLLGDQTMAG